MKTFSSLLGGGLLAVLLAAPAARAQGVFNMGSLTNTLAIPTGKAGSNTPQKASGGVAALASSFAYQPTPAMRRQTVDRAIERLQATSPAQARALATAFGPGQADYETTYAGIISGTGLGAANAADALACYLLVGYAVVHNVQNDKAITPAMTRGVRQQVLAVLARSAQPKPGDPVAAAQLGEECKLQTVVVQGGWQAALKAGKLAAYQQGISNLFKKQYGLDLAQLTLTSQGFAKR